MNLEEEMRSIDYFIALYYLSKLNVSVIYR